MTKNAAYGSPTAFRRALTDRLRVIAGDGMWTLSQLQRRVAYDRLLHRLYRNDSRWIVKGAAALLARDIGVRSTLDIDLYINQARATAEQGLRQAAAGDVGDWFRFEIGLGQQVAAGTGGVRLPAKAFIGTTVWASFSVDLFGDDLHMTGTPDEVPPLVSIQMTGVDQGTYRAYPIVDHVADKVVATFQRYGASQVASTRYKDLVDLVVITAAVPITADEQLQALTSEADRRGIVLPNRFDVPDHELWTTGYAQEARTSKLDYAATLIDALAFVRPFVDPLLDGSAHGTWDSTDRRWM